MAKIALDEGTLCTYNEKTSWTVEGSPMNLWSSYIPHKLIYFPSIILPHSPSLCSQRVIIFANDKSFWLDDIDQKGKRNVQ